MSISYSLYFYNRDFDQNFFKNTMSQMGITAISIINNAENFQINAFSPSIKLCFGYYRIPTLNQRNFTRIQDTIFEREGFIYDRFCSYDLEKRIEKDVIESQYRFVLESAIRFSQNMGISTLLLGPGGEDVFYFKDNKVYFEAKFYDFIKRKYSYLLSIFECIKYIDS